MKDKLTKKQKIEVIEEALLSIVKICPCYGRRNDDPVSIVIGNGLQLRDKNGTFITSGHNKVAHALVRDYS